MRLRADPGRFGALMAALWVAHDVADHVAQTDYQAANKAASWRAMGGHVGSYTAVQVGALALLRAAGVRPSWRRTLAAVAWSAGTHAFLDRRWPVKRALELTGSRGFADARFVVRETFTAAARQTPARGADLVDRVAVPVPLHGPYLADQALHHVCLAVSAAILAGGSDPTTIERSAA